VTPPIPWDVATASNSATESTAVRTPSTIRLLAAGFFMDPVRPGRPGLREVATLEYECSRTPR
jgi:hypothetical protein